MFVRRTSVLKESGFLNFVFRFVKYLKEIKDLVMGLSIESGCD